MNRHLQLAVCALGLLLASACSSSSGTSSYQRPTTPAGSATVAAAGASTNTAGPTGIMTAQSPLGTILTDDRGRAVYMFVADKDAVSTCSGDCAQEWPPLTTTSPPVAGTGVNAALLSTSRRGDGGMQFAYNGHPLYYYDDDKGPGTTAGQGLKSFGGNWYLLNPAGVEIDND